MPLAPPPLLQSLLLESPLPAVVALLAVGLVLVESARRRADRRFLYAAAVSALLAGAVFIAARLVVTEREAVMDRTRQLIDAATPVNESRLRSLLDDSAVVAGHDGRVIVELNDITGRLEANIRRFGVEAHEVRLLEADQPGPHTARTLVKVRTTLRGGFADAVNTAWLVTWKRKGDRNDWRATELRWIEFQGQDPPTGWQ